MSLKVQDVQIIGAELAIKWADGGESFLPLEKLRRACPCAGCCGERDIMGNLYKGPDISLTKQSFQLTGLHRIGTYALQLAWADGHNSGIYSYDYLRKLADTPESNT